MAEAHTTRQILVKGLLFDLSRTPAACLHVWSFRCG